MLIFVPYHYTIILPFHQDGFRKKINTISLLLIDLLPMICYNGEKANDRGVTMKRKTAKEILAESFRELAETVPIDKITIKDIVYNCDYSPATFYRHFKDKYDLIAFDYVQRTSEIMVKVGKNGYEWKDTLNDGLRFFEANSKYIKNLLLHTNGMDSFVRHWASANITHLTNCILDHSDLTELTPDLTIYVKMYVFGTVQTSCEWMLGEFDSTAEHLAELFEKAVPEPLKEYLNIK